MKGKSVIPLLLLSLAATVPCLAQSTRVALVDTNAFAHPKNGITRLVNAVLLVDGEFEQRYARIQEMQTRLLRMPSGLGFVGPIPTDPKPMTRERKKRLKEEKEEMERNLVLERKELRSAYEKRLKEATASISEDIFRSLEAFVKARGITMLIDTSNISCPIGCRIESAADINITHEFIAEYNRLHPWPDNSAPH